MRLVDADALVKTIESVHCKDCNSYNGAMCRACEWMDAMDYIEDAQTVDAQPVKRGMWERTDMFVKCSECGVELLDDAFLAFMFSMMAICRSVRIAEAITEANKCISDIL